MRFFILAVIAISALVATSIRVVHERNRGVNIGFQIQKTTKVLSEHKELRDQLRIQRAALLDPKRLRPKARQLKLRPVTPDEVVPMVASETKHAP